MAIFKGTTFSKPSFGVSMLVFGGVSPIGNFRWIPPSFQFTFQVSSCRWSKHKVSPSRQRWGKDTSIFWPESNPPSFGCFLKWWYPTTMGFPKNDHFGVFRGYHHLRKQPFKGLYMGVSRNRGTVPQNGWWKFHGKTLFFNGWFGWENPTIFGNTQLSQSDVPGWLATPLAWVWPFQQWPPGWLYT